MKNKKWNVSGGFILTTIISILGTIIAIKANQIYTLQAEVARNSALPTIEVTQTIQPSTYEVFGDSSIIDISNLYGKMENYSSEVASFLVCSYSSDGVFCNKLEIPIESYYFLSIKTGKVNDLIERKDAVGNYAQLRDLENLIRQDNSQNDSHKIANTYVESILRINYTDLLGNPQSQFYYIAPHTVQAIDHELGQGLLQKHRDLSERLLFIPTSSSNDFQIDELENVIEKILCISEEEKSQIETSEGGAMFKIDLDLLYTILGSTLAFLAAVIVFKMENRKKTKVCASILYHDLKSIETYVKDGPFTVNLRYFESWQNMLCECSFLDEGLVEYVYSIYDEAYNYNFLYREEKLVDGSLSDKTQESLDLLCKKIFQDNSKENTQDKYAKLIDALAKHK